MAILLPRLPSIAAEKMLEEFLGRGPATWNGFIAHDLPDAVRFAATGGTRISAASLENIRKGILTIARDCGLGSGEKQNGHARFDAEAAAWLADCPEIASGEALRDDVWSFFCVVMFPDVAHWRFGTSRERYLGGMRNTLQRLWLRASAFDRGRDTDDRWGLLRDLTEDAFVQIIERPSIGGDPVLARGIAEAWIRAASKYGRGRMEDVMRMAVLRVRIVNEVRSLSSIESKALSDLLDSYFEIAASLV
jgi:hypothetical protein